MSKKKNMAIDFQDNMILLTRKYLKRKIMCPETKFRHYVKERMHILELLKNIKNKFHCINNNFLFIIKIKI